MTTHSAQTEHIDDIDYIALDRMIEEEFYNDKENLIMMMQAIGQFHIGDDCTDVGKIRQP